jgi:hypothetical protein
MRESHGMARFMGSGQEEAELMINRGARSFLVQLHHCCQWVPPHFLGHLFENCSIGLIGCHKEEFVRLQSLKKGPQS